MVFVCLVGLKMPRPFRHVWVWSSKTPTNILNVSLPAGLQKRIDVDTWLSGRLETL